MSLRLWTMLFSFASAFAVAFASLHCLHMLQLESYQGNMYRKWLARSAHKDVYICLLVGIAALFLRTAWILLYYDVGEVVSEALRYGSDAVYILGLLYIGFSKSKQPEKKKFVVTGRILRLLVVIGVLSFFLHESLLIQSSMSNWAEVMLVDVLRYLPGALLPYFVLVCYYVTLPVEACIKKYYFNNAKRKLRACDGLIKIGLTGSFGKTSTKYILGTLLSEQYRTLFTPGSYNTPMGVTRVIREQLDKEHEAFIAEMGARYKGDIDELCELVQPRYGLITSIGKQHLDTFGSLAGVIETKGELLRRLPADGAAFLNGDIPECRRMYEECTLKNKFLFGITGEGLYMRADDLRVTTSGSTFRLIADDGQSVNCKTALLGAHNIMNITGAASLAKYLGISMEMIAAGIEKVEPIAHRLQLIQGPVTVIDDAFNANPAGTKAALEVLKAFAPAHRVVVTPGMVELGDEEQALNEEFGRALAQAADVVFIVGKQNAQALKSGLIKAGFAQENSIEVDTLEQVTALLPQYAPPGSVVLFENDLPDNYL